MAERSALPIIITDAGRQAAVDADHNGLKLELTEIALGKTLWEPDSSATTLKSEFKRITSFGGVNLAADMLHFTITDDSSDNYELGEFGLYSDTGILFAVYSQSAVISEKIADSVFMLSVDIRVDSVPPGSVTITGNNFHYPPATTDVLGVMYDAPRDGKNYVRKNGAWLEVPPQDNEWRPGDIKMFAGSVDDIQPGWKLCDGEGETSTGIKVPDLRDRMIMCAGTNHLAGTTGGNETVTTSNSGIHSHSVNVHSHTLTQSQMPSHQHYYEWYAQDTSNQLQWGGGRGKGFAWTYSTGSSNSHSHSAHSGDAGDHNHTVSTLPPYYALAFIIKL